MEDASTIILPPEAATDDDSGLRELLGLLVETTDRRWAEMTVRLSPTGPTRQIGVGNPSAPSATIELELGDSAGARLTIGGETPPPGAAIDAFAACLVRELHRLRLLAESTLLQSAANSADAAVLIFGPSGNIVFANRLADRLISKQTEDELAVNGNDRAPLPLFSLLCTQVSELLDHHDSPTRTDRLEVSDGSELSCSLVALPAVGRGFGPSVMAILREISGPSGQRVDHFAALHRLSPREHEVLRLLVQGFDTAGLADRLGISPHTVRDHLKHVFRKTSTRSRSELLSALSGAAPSLSG